MSLLTSGTCGPPSTGSSESAALQSSLASKLRARLSTLGSTLYSLTWKDWTTGVPARVGRLRGYGNAINPWQAAHFLQAAVEAIRGLKS